jgi:hypothetical protein
MGGFSSFGGWMDGLCFIRTLLQRPFQQEFRGALGTRSTIINYGKEKKVCAASRHNLSKSVGVEEASRSPWEHAEVANRRSIKGKAPSKRGGGKKRRTERGKKNKKIKK